MEIVTKAHGKIEITEDDNFTTYPLLQTAKGVKLEIEAIEMIKNGKERGSKNIKDKAPMILMEVMIFAKFFFKTFAIAKLL